MCVSHVCLVPQRVLDFPRTGGMGGSEPPDVLGTKLRSTKPHQPCLSSLKDHKHPALITSLGL